MGWGRFHINKWSKSMLTYINPSKLSLTPVICLSSLPLCKCLRSVLFDNDFARLDLYPRVLLEAMFYCQIAITYLYLNVSKQRLKESHVSVLLISLRGTI